MFDGVIVDDKIEGVGERQAEECSPAVSGEHDPWWSRSVPAACMHSRHAQSQVDCNLECSGWQMVSGGRGSGERLPFFILPVAAVGSGCHFAFCKIPTLLISAATGCMHGLWFVDVHESGYILHSAKVLHACIL